jgi:Holliday junction DNA helicase RuvA
MISRIEGELLSVKDGRALLACEAITYEVFVPGADEQRLATMINQSIALHTLHYLESQGPTGPYFPRLIGFASIEDREFFELFTTVKNIGYRKALRALQLPFGAVAAAIAEKDLDLLKSLPEIGKRTAETIVAELNGKVDRFVELKPGEDRTRPVDDAHAALLRDAIAVLTQLGEQRLTARQLVDRAIAADPTIPNAELLVAAAFRLKES